MEALEQFRLGDDFPRRFGNLQSGGRGGEKLAQRGEAQSVGELPEVGFFDLRQIKGDEGFLIANPFKGLGAGQLRRGFYLRGRERYDQAVRINPDVVSADPPNQQMLAAELFLEPPRRMGDQAVASSASMTSGRIGRSRVGVCGAPV